jgi:hypothetical protein
VEGIVDSPQLVVIEHDTVDSPVIGESPCLRLDLLGGKNPSDGSQAWVPIEQLQVASQLFDTVDISPTLELDRHGASGGVSGEDIDGAKCRHVFPPDEREALTEGFHIGSEKFLELGLNAIFDEARINPEFVRVITMDLMDVDHEQVRGFMVDDFPDLDNTLSLQRRIGGDDLKRAGRGHPVEGFVAATIGVNQDTAVIFDHDHTCCQGKVGVEATGVIHGTGSNNESHTGESTVMGGCS